MAGGGLVMMLVFMLVLVSVAGRHRAALAVHPAGITASIMFFLPDRHAMFHFVDDEPAGVEGLAAVRGADTDPHGHSAQAQGADTMDPERVLYREAPQALRNDPPAFLHPPFMEHLRFQRRAFLSIL